MKKMTKEERAEQLKAEVEKLKATIKTGVKAGRASASKPAEWY